MGFIWKRYGYGGKSCIWMANLRKFPASKFCWFFRIFLPGYINCVNFLLSCQEVWVEMWNVQSCWEDKHYFTIHKYAVHNWFMGPSNQIITYEQYTSWTLRAWNHFRKHCVPVGNVPFASHAQSVKTHSLGEQLTDQAYLYWHVRQLMKMPLQIIHRQRTAFYAKRNLRSLYTIYATYASEIYILCSCVICAMWIMQFTQTTQRTQLFA